MALEMKRPVAEVRVNLRQDLALELDLAAQELVAAERAGTATDEQRDRVKALTDEAASAWVTVQFRCIGRKAYTDLVTEHTDSESGELNSETFGPALLSASAVDQDTDWNTVWDEWPLPDVNRLFEAALSIQVMAVSLPKEPSS